jgi:hypothetical protein
VKVIVPVPPSHSQISKSGHAGSEYVTDCPAAASFTAPWFGPLAVSATAPPASDTRLSVTFQIPSPVTP